MARIQARMARVRARSARMRARSARMRARAARTRARVGGRVLRGRLVRTGLLLGAAGLLLGRKKQEEVKEE